MARKKEKMFQPAYHRYFSEAIERENKIRCNWELKYGTLSKKFDAVNWDEDPSDDECEICAREDVCLSEAFQPWRMPSKEERAWLASTTPPSRTIPRVSNPPITMKPVPRDVRKVLYQGLSHDGEGRAEYLRRRYQFDPEERYYFPVCSSWEHGWTYRNSGFSQCPKHSRRQA